MTFNKICGSEGDGTVPRRTRRQALTVIAVASCLPFFPRTGAMAKAIDSLAHQWRGTALGAEATITLHHPNSQRACHLIELCIAEIERLERVFSLYRPASELARLSRTGQIDCPSPELVALLEASRRMALLSNGAFDPTVQPLWRLYAAHADAARRLPDRRTLAAALRLVGFGNVEFDRRRIRLTEPGMSVTLNGIAQGYISDRVGDLLRDAGLESVLVELGEIVAIGRPAAGTPWRVALASPDGARPRSPGSRHRVDRRGHSDLGCLRNAARSGARKSSSIRSADGRLPGTDRKRVRRGAACRARRRAVDGPLCRTEPIA